VPMLQTVVRAGVAALLVTAPVALAGAAEKNPVVAKIDGHEIHMSDLEAEKALLPTRVRQLPMEQVYRPLLERVITNRLLTNAARKAKLQNDPEVKARLARLEDALIREVYISKKIQDQITEEAVKKRYKEMLKSRKPTEEIEARHILVKTEKEARAIIKQLEKGANFAKLASKKSMGPTKDQGGNLGWFSRGDMVKEFEDAAFALKKGQFTKEPVKTQFGWHVIKVEGRREKPAPELKEVRQQITQTLLRELYQAEIKRLIASAKIERFAADGKPLAHPKPAGGTKKK
jgi:peptidyl-prolyl cis-trans isomerase C